MQIKYESKDGEKSKSYCFDVKSEEVGLIIGKLIEKVSNKLEDKIGDKVDKIKEILKDE